MLVCSQMGPSWGNPGSLFENRALNVPSKALSMRYRSQHQGCPCACITARQTFVHTRTLFSGHPFIPAKIAFLSCGAHSSCWIILCARVCHMGHPQLVCAMGHPTRGSCSPTRTLLYKSILCGALVLHKGCFATKLRAWENTSAPCATRAIILGLG